MIEKKKREVSGLRSLSIGALSRATRIPVETLRTWERRYGSPVPERKPSGHRLYPASSVEHLRLVGRLLSQGHRAGAILGLPVRELEALLQLSGSLPHRSMSEPEASSIRDVPVADSITELLRSARDLDRDSMMREFRTLWGRLGPLRFLVECAGAFMVAVGESWREKTLEIRHEHFASACLTDFLGEVREPYEDRARGPRVVLAMLPGDPHEGGLVMVRTLMAVRGHRVVYLGLNTPIDEIAAAARSGVEAVALSVSAAMTRPRAAQGVAQLRDSVPRRIPLWVGGAGAPPSAKGVEYFESLEALDARLASH